MSGLGRGKYIGEFADDASILTFIRNNKWDSESNGTGDPIQGMTYYDTTLECYKQWKGGKDAWEYLTLPRVPKFWIIDKSRAGEGYEEDGSDNQPFTSIQNAFDALTTDGHILFIKGAGVYSESLTLPNYHFVLDSISKYLVSIEQTDEICFYFNGDGLTITEGEVVFKNISVNMEVTTGAKQAFYFDTMQNRKIYMENVDVNVDTVLFNSATVYGTKCNSGFEARNCNFLGASFVLSTNNYAITKLRGCVVEHDLADEVIISWKNKFDCQDCIIRGTALSGNKAFYHYQGSGNEHVFRDCLVDSGGDDAFELLQSAKLQIYNSSIFSGGGFYDIDTAAEVLVETMGTEFDDTKLNILGTHTQLLNAKKISTPTKTNLGSATNLEDAVDYMNTQNPIKHSEGAGSPEGSVDGVWGDEYTDTTNGLEYKKMSASGNTGWRQHGFSAKQVTVTSTPVNITQADNNTFYIAAVTSVYNLPAAYDGGRYRFVIGAASTTITINPNGSEIIGAPNMIRTGGPYVYWSAAEANVGFAVLDIMAFPGTGWIVVDGAKEWWDPADSANNRICLSSPFEASSYAGGAEWGVVLSGSGGGADAGSLAIGDNNFAKNQRNFLHGKDGATENVNTIVGGEGGFARWDGSHVIGAFPREDLGGGDYAYGKRQAGWTSLLATSTDTTDAQLAPYGAGTMYLPEETFALVEMKIIARKNGEEDKNAAWKLTFAVEMRTSGAGGPEIKAESVNLELLYRDSASEIDNWQVKTPEVGGTAPDQLWFRVLVNGNSGTVNWSAKIDWVELGAGHPFTP